MIKSVEKSLNVLHHKIGGEGIKDVGQMPTQLGHLSAESL